MAKFEIGKDCFTLNGEKIQLVSGAMHYFRIVPEYWKDRLQKLKELGCNCVETYLAWNLHEKQEGNFVCDGWLDFGKYLQEAQEQGLYAIVRPGPFICSECDFGGLPWWLLQYDGIELRTYNHIYLEKVEKYIDKVCEILRPHLITNGGNVVLVQIENEFGSYGDDQRYLKTLQSFYEKNGIVAGFIGLNGNYIEGLFVKKEFRSSGIGTALLDHVKKQKSSLKLHVYCENQNAVAFYIKNGFSVKEKLGSAPADEYAMLWEKEDGSENRAGLCKRVL